MNEKIPLIFNFLPISTGGGLQNSLSFLQTLARDESLRTGSVAIVRRSTEIHRLCEEYGISVIPVVNNPLARVQFELSCRQRFQRGQTCFTIFGPPMLGSAGYLLNVVGCAYSNLFYPEIWFWRFRTPLMRLKAEVIDILRRWGMVRADYWIFETPILAERAVSLANFPTERVGVVRMAASRLVAPEFVQDELVAELSQRMPSSFRFLFLCSDYPNKRLHELPAIAQQLHAAGVREFSFITTMRESSAYARSLREAFAVLQLSEHHCNLGPVAAATVPSLIHCCDVMCTFSVLESFSNNYVEAWRMEKPLVVTDADWARDACGDGGYYVDPANAVSTAQALALLMADAELRAKCVRAGTMQLATYPDADDKNLVYFVEIAKAQALGMCADTQRKQIRWPSIQRGE